MSFHNVLVAQEEIDSVANKIGRGMYGGHKATLRVAKFFGFKAEMTYVTRQPNASAGILLSNLASEPLLVTGRFHHHPDLPQSSGHAVVAIGFEVATSAVVYHDPHHRKAELKVGESRRVDLAEFVRRWSTEHHGWVLWLRGRV